MFRPFLMRPFQLIEKSLILKLNIKIRNWSGASCFCKSGCIKTIKLLLSEGFDIDSKDRNGATLSMWTAFYGQQGAFQMLLQNGADASLKVNHGFSLVHCAVKGGNIVDSLLTDTSVRRTSL